MNKPAVLCAGAMVLDTLVRPVQELRWGTTTFVDTIETRVGGSAANTARALGILGVGVRIAGLIGQDRAAEIVLHELTRCNVDLSAIGRSEHPTAETVVLINQMGDRQFLHRPGCSSTAFHNGLTLDADNLRGITHLHVASLFVVPHLRTQAPGMLADARSRGLSTSLDTSWDPQGEWMRVLDPCLPHLHVLFVNEDEAANLASGGSTESLAESVLRRGTEAVVAKQGQSGCTIFTASETVNCPAYRVDSRDTTGAGDCFVAAFLAAYLEGESLGRAGMFGNAAGALSVQQIGAVEGLLPRSDLAAWMDQTPVHSR